MIRAQFLRRISGIIAFLLISSSLFLAGCGPVCGNSATIPAAPVGVNAISGDGLIVLGWKASSRASSYNIYLAESPLVTKSTYTTLPGGTKITGAMSPYTVTGLTNGMTYYAVITAVNSAGESGESGQTQGTPVLGSGDTVPNYVPLTVGNTWNKFVTLNENGFTTTFTRTTTISGTRTINGATALVLSETDSNAPNTVDEEYLLKDSNGVISLGDNDTGPLREIFPYWDVKYPIETENFTQVDKIDLDWGEDLDGDGINEKADFTSHVSVVTQETVTVPAGSWTCPREQTSVIMTVKLSKDNSSIIVIATLKRWFAQGVGQVKATMTTTNTSTGYTETETEELTGYTVH